MTSKADLVRQWSERARRALPTDSGRTEMLRRAIQGAAANEFAAGNLPQTPRPLIVRSLPTETLPQKQARWTLDLESRVGRHDLTWGEPYGPSADWTRGAMLGNGDLGVAVHGFPDNLSMVFGKTDLWDRRDPGRGFLPQCTFAELRRCYESQDEEEYLRLAATLPTYPLPCFMPAGVLRLRVAEAAINARCSQHHNLYRATSETTFLPAGQYQQGQRARGAPTTIRALVSQPHEVLLTRLTPGVYPLGPVGIEYSRSPEADVPAPEVSVADSTLLLRYRLPAGDSYVIGIRGDHDLNWQQAGHRFLGDVDLADGELVIYSTVVTELDAQDPAALAGSRLQTAVEDGADEVEKRHAEWWRFYWNRGYVAIDDEDAERGWYRALYICGSCLRAGKHSPGLQGAWIKEHQPAWRADYHANLNIQATYWSCFTANRLDLVEPLLAFYLSILPRCQRDTREFFEMEGSYLPHSCDVFGNPTGNATVLPLLASMSPACWLASLFWDYYEYSGDLDYLQEWGYPLLREVTRFSEDYLSFHDDRGRIAPSICWEVNTGSLEGWGVNSQYDLAAVRRLWELTLAAAEILGNDTSDRGRWTRRLARLPDFPVDVETNAWKAFEDKPPLFKKAHGPWLTCPVFPFEQVSLYHGSRQWYERAVAAAHQEREHGISLFDMERDWCGYFTANAVRLGLPEEAQRLARIAAEPTLGFRRSWENPKFMVDHAPGMGRALNDMLLLSLGGTIHLFPGVPRDVSARFHSLRTAGAFLITSEKRGSEIPYAVVHSLAGQNLRIASPFGEGEPLLVRLRCLDNGEVVFEAMVCRFSRQDAKTVDLAADQSGRWTLETPTKAGATYILERSDRPVETVEMEAID